MAKRKKGSKVQKRAKLRGGNSARRGKARKVAKSAKATRRSAKPKRAPVKKAARKEITPEVANVEHPATELEEVSQLSPGHDETEKY